MVKKLVLISSAIIGILAVAWLILARGGGDSAQSAEANIEGQPEDARHRAWRR